jgi:PPK2 family polyphosphate:nucleotide phosphotransferase
MPSGYRHPVPPSHDASADAKTLEALTVKPGEAARLDGRDPAWNGGPEFGDFSRQDRRAQAQAALAERVAQLDATQQLLWASDRHALLIVLQAMDAAGKDGTIRHVMSGVNPQGVEVTSFKQPSTAELDHDFLWRTAQALPARGRIAVFNRSHYEEVVAVRVHPEWLELQHLEPGDRDDAFWRKRFESINSFEHHIARNGTKIVKLFLHVSKREQRKRLLARLEEPGKEWKFSAADVADRAHWDEYMHAYEQAITATSTAWAPWHVIPADSKPLMRALAAAVIIDALSSLDLRPPPVTPEQHAANEQARIALEGEDD